MNLQPLHMGYMTNILGYAFLSNFIVGLNDSLTCTILQKLNMLDTTALGNLWKFLFILTTSKRCTFEAYPEQTEFSANKLFLKISANCKFDLTGF